MTCTRCLDAVPQSSGVCWTCEFWIVQLGQPGGLVIDGGLYFVGPEPTSTDLMNDPKAYGCYGAAFLIGRDDGTQILTHNLVHCGPIPQRFNPRDNAAFLHTSRTHRADWTRSTRRSKR